MWKNQVKMKGPRGMNASDFWDVMDTNALARDEIVLLTRYLVDSYGKNGFKIPAENFMREAKIEHAEELDDAFGDYFKLLRNEQHKKDDKGLDCWGFFCHERLKLKRLQENNLPLNVDEENDTVSGPVKVAYRKLADYILRYFNQNVMYADCHVEKHGKGQQAIGSTRSDPKSSSISDLNLKCVFFVLAASRKRKGSEQNVQEEKKVSKGSEQNVKEEKEVGGSEI